MPNAGVWTLVGDISAPPRRQVINTPASRSRQAVSTSGRPSEKAASHASCQPGRRNGAAAVRRASASHSCAIGAISARVSTVTVPR
jgi:hypothetical protein